MAVDWDPHTGLDHLAAFGAFDEISLGSSWNNQTLIRHTWELGHSPATPGVMVIQRELIADEGAGELLLWRIEDAEPLLWRSGVEEIRILSMLDPVRYLGPIVAKHASDEQAATVESVRAETQARGSIRVSLAPGPYKDIVPGGDP